MTPTVAPPPLPSFVRPAWRMAWRSRLALALLAGAATAWSAGSAGTAPTIMTLKKLSLEELMNVQVTSVSREPENLSKTASAIQVVTGDEIRRAGATSLPEALRLAGNLDVAQKDSHQWGISARGFNTELANKLLVMTDGRTIYTPLFSGVLWELQDYLLEDIDRIEVISGPGGTLWGANAVNGVINIITRSAKDSQGLYAEAGVGSTLSSSVGVRYGATLAPGAYLRVYGKSFRRDDEVLANGQSAVDAARAAQGGFRFDSEMSELNTFTLSGDYYDGHQMSTAGEARTSGGNLVGRWTHFFASGSEFRLQCYYDRTNLERPQPAFVLGGKTLAPAGRFEDHLDTVDVDFQHHFNVGTGYRLMWGANYRGTRDVVSNAPSLAFLPARLNQTLLGAFVQGVAELSLHQSLTVGTKLERNDYTGTELEPSVRYQWSVSPVHSVWAAVSRAVRRPSRIDRDLVQGAPPAFTLLAGSSDFNSEELTAYEVGHRARFGPHVASSLSLFFNDYDDVRSTAFDPRTVFPLSFHNDLAGHTYGLELTSDFQPVAAWRLHLGYDLLKEKLHIKPGGSDVNKALNETSDPAHQFFLRSSVDLPHGVEWDAGFRWIAARPTHSGPNPGTLPAYAELDVRLGWHPHKNVELSLVGQNLLHDRHGEYGFPSPTVGEIRRSVFAKAAWRF